MNDDTATNGVSMNADIMNSDALMYLIAVILPKDFAEKIFALQKKFKTPAWNITVGPHITLMPPARAMASMKTAALQLRDLARELKEFEIEVSGIGFFKNASKTIFAKVELSESILTLRQALAEAAPKFMDFRSENPEFHPHITIANKLDDKNFRPVLLEIQKEFKGFKFLCNNFSLLTKSPKIPKWLETETILLSS